MNQSRITNIIRDGESVPLFSESLSTLCYRDKNKTETIEKCIVEFSEEIGALKEIIYNIKDDMINKLYPIGSVKITKNYENPGTLIDGTTWELVSKGAYLRGVDPDNEQLNSFKRGGSNIVNMDHTHIIPGHGHSIAGHTHTTGSHVLTLAEMPLHNHAVSVNSSGSCTISKSGGHTHSVGVRKDNTTGGSAERLGNSANRDIRISPILDDTGKHTHTVPNHTHSITQSNRGSNAAHGHGETSSVPLTTDFLMAHNTTNGKDDEINVVVEPEYQTMYIWQRVS